MITFRKARPDEAQRLTELCDRTFRATFEKDNSAEDMNSYCAQCFTPAAQREEILDPRKRVILAEIGDELVGYFILAEGPPTDASITVAITEPAIEISRFYLEAKHHGSRSSHTMMQHAIALARSEGFKTMWLGVWERNTRAIAFYKKWIFKEVGEHIFALGSDPQRDLILMHGL